MRQLLQSLSDGKTYLSELPIPNARPGEIIIQTSCSLISPGTEKMLVEFGKANLISKAKQQPDKLKEVFDKAKTDGPISTFESIKNKLENPIPLGYSNVGKIIKIGSEVTNFKIGQRVVSNGPHAEIVSVPKNLCALIPNNVTNEEASFTVLGSIALNGIRLAKPTFGETFVVSGLGLIGLITAQLLKAQGCRVIGLDPDSSKCSLAESLGILSYNLNKDSDPISFCLGQTNDIGVDGVIITASTTSNEPIDLSAKICRQRGRIVLIGVTGLNLRRDLFYKKELSFMVSCSYGPGRYDQNYEKKGIDYPIGFVRWTEKRNFESILIALQEKQIDIKPLISHHFDFLDSPKAYELLTSEKQKLGIIIDYPENKELNHNDSVILNSNLNSNKKDLPVLDFIGAGNYISKVLLPAFSKTKVKFNTISAFTGVGASYLAKKFGFKKISTNIADVLQDQDSDAVIIATRHDTHAKYVINAIKNKKHIFVEKPLCLNKDELNAIKEEYFLSIKNNFKPILMVGFNRRFSPLIKELKKQLLKCNGPISFIYTCNVGEISNDHWIQNPKIGGGRLVGEACHFIDLLRYLAGDRIDEIKIVNAKTKSVIPDIFSLSLHFENGSIGTIHYFSNGSKSFNKEKIEVFVDGKIFLLDNFQKLKAWGCPGFITKRSIIQDKGQIQCVKEFIKSLNYDSLPPIEINEIFEIHEWLFKEIQK